MMMDFLVVIESEEKHRKLFRRIASKLSQALSVRIFSEHYYDAKSMEIELNYPEHFPIHVRFRSIQSILLEDLPKFIREKKITEERAEIMMNRYRERFLFQIPNILLIVGIEGECAKTVSFFRNKCEIVYVAPNSSSVLHVLHEIFGE